MLSNLLDHAWRTSKSLEMETLLRQIQTPPFDKVGFVDLETFFPAKQRFELAMKLNNLLSSPAFSGWMTGEPLDISRLLYTAAGKPRLAIISIAHLSDSERMFFVTILLSELLAWVRTQSGTSSLRALFYMDEVFGYFPPSANPPSKVPMLTLLKQARAFGLGIVLATQNPVDLDYKSLSNAGTWFLGRLQTQRDKDRVLDGLEGAAASAGSQFNRKQMAEALSALGNRVFLMNNVHDDHPVVFETRWTLSYLRGPLTRDQVQQLMAPIKAAMPASGARTKTRTAAVKPPAAADAGESSGSTMPDAANDADAAGDAPVASNDARPVLPPGVPEVFLAAATPLKKGISLEYRPLLLGSAKVHFVQAKSNVDQWCHRTVLAELGDDGSGDVWNDAHLIAGELNEAEPANGARYAGLPSELSNAKNYSKYATALKSHLYRDDALTLFDCKAGKLTSKPLESEADFRARLSQKAREERDANVEKLRQSYAAKRAALAEQLAKAKQKVADEKSQVTHQVVQTVITIGTAVLTAVLGRKTMTQQNMRTMSTAARTGAKTYEQHGNVDRAELNVEVLEDNLKTMDDELNEKIAALDASVRADSFALDEIKISSRKSDIAVERVALAWAPYHVDSGGRAEAAYLLPKS